MKNLKELFKNNFAKTAFKHDEAEYSQYQVVGKYCIISLEGTEEEPILDIWLTNLTKSLSPRKITFMVSLFDNVLLWNILEGEAIAKTFDMDFIIRNRTVLGIRKKKILTEDQLNQLKLMRK
jgi:hypothetical protein